MRALARDTATPCENSHTFEGPESLYWTDPLMRALAWDTRITCEYCGTFRSKERLHGFRREFINADQLRLLPGRTIGVVRGHPALRREIGLHRFEGTRAAYAIHRLRSAAAMSLRSPLRGEMYVAPGPLTAYLDDVHDEPVVNSQNGEAVRHRGSEFAQDARELHSLSPSGSHNSEPRGSGRRSQRHCTPVCTRVEGPASFVICRSRPMSRRTAASVPAQDFCAWHASQIGCSRQAQRGTTDRNLGIRQHAGRGRGVTQFSAGPREDSGDVTRRGLGETADHAGDRPEQGLDPRRPFMLRFSEETLKHTPARHPADRRVHRDLHPGDRGRGVRAINHYVGTDPISRAAAVIAPGAVVMAMIYVTERVPG